MMLPQPQADARQAVASYGDVVVNRWRSGEAVDDPGSTPAPEAAVPAETARASTDVLPASPELTPAHRRRVGGKVLHLLHLERPEK